MLILCPSCATSYDVELASLQPNGRQVRCVRCRVVWRAEPTQAQRLVAAAEAIAPSRAAHAAAQDFALQTARQPVAGHPADAANEAQWSVDASDEQAADGQSFEALQEAPQPAPAAAANVPGSEIVAPPIVPADLDDGGLPLAIDADHGAASSAEPQDDIETVAARRYRRSSKPRPWRWPLSRLQSATLALLIVDSIVIGWRVDFVRIFPQTASFFASMGLPVNLRGLAFEAITIDMEQHEGVPILVVQGNVVNDSRQVADVPRLKFAVRNAARQEIYSWTAVPPRGMLPPGEAVAFRSRLASPPPDGRDVLVRFVNRRDILAGAR